MHPNSDILPSFSQEITRIDRLARNTLELHGGGVRRSLVPTIAVVSALAVGAGLSIDHATAIGSGAAVKPGMAVPAFSAPDIAGKTVSLADYAGKIVILEWTNDSVTIPV